MANPEALTKRLAINKANVQMVIIVGVASFITVFCLVAAHSLWGQNAYESRVINAKSTAYNQLESNILAYKTLTSSYESFVSKPNVIGSSTSGSGNNAINNAQVVLDALPPSYDFPALATSMTKLLSDNGFSGNDVSISGTDNQLTEQNNISSPDPQPVSMPFSFTVNNASYQSVTQLINALQESIRPIQIDTMTLSGAASSMTLEVTAHTYFQPSKSLNITKQVVQ